MPTEELSEIPRPIRDDYARLLTDIAISEGVAPEIIAELLKVKQGTGISIFARGKPTTVKLSVDREFPIILDTKRGGRVFELAGQSDRNKTTSLIYMATILGINWDQTRPFLDRDDKVYNIATQRVRLDLSRGQNAELRLASKAYELSITVADSCATVSLLDENRHFTPGFNSTCISLASLEDWQRYRELMMSICDVQFVGKSRDFIGQVSIEESKDLSQFCEIVLDRAGRVRSYLQNQPQTYSRTEQELKTEIAQMTKRRADMKKEIDELNQQIEIIENFIRDIQKLLATYRELEDTQNSEVQEALRRLKLEEAVRDQDKKLQEYERSIQDMERELEDALQQLSQQEPRFTSVMSSLEDLRVKISGELKDISALNSLCSQVLRGIANKDYNPMFTFCNFAQVDNNVITLLDSILEATRPFSKGLVIPFKFRRRAWKEAE